MRINSFKLQTALMETGMQQKHFAKYANISEGTLYNVLSGGGCSQRTLNRIAKALDADINDFIE